MEYLDYYTEDGKYLGKDTRENVHKDAKWHNTVHCWLYDDEGDMYFQIREDEKTFYTTASGHVLAGETIKEGFGREISEEIGVFVNYDSAELVEVNKFVMDKIKKDGTVFRDRAFANVYVCKYNNDYKSFNYDSAELSGLVKVNAKKILDLFKGEILEANALIIKKDESGANTASNVMIKNADFLVCNGENTLDKYGKIAKKVISLTK